MKIKENYLSVENCNCVKGILAIIILIHHVEQFGYFHLPPFFHLLTQSTGYLAVSLFLFFTGVGLRAQADGKPDYSKKFLRNKIFSLYLVYLFATALYLLLYLAGGKTFTFADIAGALFLHPIYITNGWFFYNIFFLYITFYITALLTKKPSCQIGLVTAAVLCYVVASAVMGAGYWMYVSIPAMPLGMLYQRHKQVLDRFFMGKLHWWIAFCAAGSGFCVCFLFSNMYSIPAYLNVIMKTGSSLFFVVLVPLLLMKIPVKNVVTKALGNIFFEMYIAQGITFYFWSSLVPLASGGAYVAAIISTSVLLAFLLHPVCSGIIKKVRK